MQSVQKPWVRAKSFLLAMGLGCLTLTVFPDSARAWSYDLGLGYLGQNFGFTSAQASGDAGTFGASSLTLNWNARGEIGGSGWFLNPWLAFTPLHRSDSDEAIEQRDWFFAFDLGLPLGESNWDVRAGTGLKLQSLSGNGGLVQLDNGNSTSTFALPSYSATTLTLGLNAGVGGALPGLLDGRLRLDLDTWVTGAFSSDRRAWDLLAALSWNLGGSR